MRYTNTHVIEVTYISATDTLPSRVGLHSHRFRDRKRIEYDHSFGSTLEIAIDWLERNGFEITGVAESKNSYFVISTTFKPLNYERC